MSIESRMILETARKFQEEARHAMIANRKDTDEGRRVDPELERLLFQVLGALNHASHMITQVLARGHGTFSAPTVEAEVQGASPSGSEVSQPAVLDRVQEYEPAEAQEAGRRRRAPRGSFNPSREDLRAMRETMTVKAIGEKYGVSMATVMNRLRDAGLTSPRDPGRRGGRPRKG